MKRLVTLALIMASMTVLRFGPADVHAADPDPCTTVTKDATVSQGVLDTINCIKPDNAKVFLKETLSSDKTLDTPDKAATFIKGVLQTIAGLLAGVSGIFAVAMIVKGGFHITTSAGEKSGIEKGTKSIKWGAIGLLSIILAYNIVFTILSLLFEVTAEVAPAESSTNTQTTPAAEDNNSEGNNPTEGSTEDYNNTGDYDSGTA